MTESTSRTLYNGIVLTVIKSFIKKNKNEFTSWDIAIHRNELKMQTDEKIGTYKDNVYNLYQHTNRYMKQFEDKGIIKLKRTEPATRGPMDRKIYELV